jgi:hypothetical protein
MSGIKRTHFVTYVEHPKYGGRVRIVTCSREYIQKWTTDEAAVSCFSCLRVMGKLEPKPKKKVVKERVCTLCKRLGRPGFACRKCGVSCCEHLCGNKEAALNGRDAIPATCTSCLIKGG